MVSIITKSSQGLLFWGLKRHAATQKFKAIQQIKNGVLKKNSTIVWDSPEVPKYTVRKKDLHFIVEKLCYSEPLKIRP